MIRPYIVQNSSMDNCLLIFLKYPEAGKVKTRLAREIGPEEAAQLYRLFVEAMLRHTLDKNGYYEQLLFYTPVEREGEIVSWIGKQMRGAECGVGAIHELPLLYPQTGTDLGERMLNALETAYSNGAKKAVIIGTDSPTLNRETIYEAFCLLKDNDVEDPPSSGRVVIGPTVDGGYYLIGVSLPASAGIFTGIDWGSGKVFEQTIKRLKEGNVSYSLLPLHYDVDNLEDLRTLKQEILKMDVIKRSNLLDIYDMLENELNI